MNNSDFLALVRGFTLNILLLFGTVLIYQVSRFTNSQKGLMRNVIIGLFVGFIGVLIMTFPFEFEAGLIFDARSVLYLVSGYFFGPIVTFVSAIAGIAYRIFVVGGGGMYAGVATIAISSCLDWLGTRSKSSSFVMAAFLQVLHFGFRRPYLVVMCQFLIFLPRMSCRSIRMIAIRSCFFPIATAIVALSLENNRPFVGQETILQQKLLLQSSVDTPQASRSTP
jgi:hypothetical protein